MYTDQIDAEYLDSEYLLDPYQSPAERSCDVQFPAVVNFILLVSWGLICLLGLVVILVEKKTTLGLVIIGVPTFFGMVMKPTFALSLFMLVLPTGAGIGIGEVFTLNKGVGLALAFTFLLNILITRPRLKFQNKALWVIVFYTIWIFLNSLSSPYLQYELVRVLTQVQLLALVFITYWILTSNGENALRWALRCYVIGMLVTIAITYITGAAVTNVSETTQERYATTATGTAIDANMLAVLVGLAFIAAIYLLASDKRIMMRLLYLVAILWLPIMLVRIGSRGGLVAITFTLLSPLLFVKQTFKKPALILILAVILILAGGSIIYLVKSQAVEEGVAKRLTDTALIEESVNYRMSLVKGAIRSVLKNPFGTTHYGWFSRSGLETYPHNDFFYTLGIYGLPGASLFIALLLTIMFAIKRMPFSIEKFYARAVLTFLFITGLNIGQVYKKHYWIFLAIVMAITHINNKTSHYFMNKEYETDEEEYSSIDYFTYVSQ